ncbi:molybdenum ABC transporter ATP-binding protein [Rhodococcus sp. WMMA185]|uniref:sulfate/molybdate ABC transporter ATP-binding protein n=1 Tax=Rhodococcus sp. WMMA185 TaxID=679318 RepID=UPI0008783AD7|nr:ATP-binding cassette domain-containing protein [Rhodococcus sp. WMMA185]AOW95209.1 molybdenum ABC transporter ATP-binding protein [Rhodococcus sp. WMMA185]
MGFDLGAGEVLAVLGPNGAGKSTALSVIAGLVRPDAGRVELNGRVLTDTDRGVMLPAHRRCVALLAQQALLFPHLTVAANVAFAPRSAGRSRREARGIAERWLDAVDATQFAERRPHELSGGQAQRVAVARALAADPQALLLDEPMAALDVSTAPALRVLLRQVLREGRRTAVVVTHDVLDALALADRVIVVDDGRVVESGSVRDVLTRPRSPFGARIAGLNLVPVSGAPDDLVAATGARMHGLPGADFVPGSAAVAVFAPHAVAVHRHRPEGSPRNVFRVTISEIEVRGPTVRVRADAGGRLELSADVTVASVAELDLVPGANVFFVIKAAEVALHAARAV